MHEYEIILYWSDEDVCHASRQLGSLGDEGPVLPAARADS